VMLSKYYTPRLMADLIINSIKQWSASQQVPRPTYNPRDFDDELDQELHSRILTGWAHFLHGQNSQAWKPVIALYYRSREPGEIYSPNLRMRKATEQTWRY